MSIIETIHDLLGREEAESLLAYKAKGIATNACSCRARTLLYQVLNGYIGRIPLVSSGGPSGERSPLPRAWLLSTSAQAAWVSFRGGKPSNVLSRRVSTLKSDSRHLQ